MKTHKEFMEEVIEANSLPARTCRALSPESKEDYDAYVLEGEK